MTGDAGHGADRLVGRPRHRAALRPGPRPAARRGHRRRLRRPVGLGRRSDRGGRPRRRPEDRADQPGRAGAVRRRPARLRRAASTAWPARRGRRSTPPARCSPRSRPRSRSCWRTTWTGADDRPGRGRRRHRLRGRRAGDRGQPDRRLGHRHRRHDRRQRLLRPVRARRPATAARSPRPGRVRHDAAPGRRGWAGRRGWRAGRWCRPGRAPPASGTRWPPSPGWRRPCATTAARCGPGRSSCPAPSARWSPVAPGDAFQADISGVGQVSAVFAEGNRHDRGNRVQGGRHRLGQHRHRPDDQDAPARAAPRGRRRWSASTRPPTASPGRAGSACRPPPTGSTA